MEDSIILDGKKYISSKRAAQLGGYTKDYIGQMCRSGKLNAKLLGRNWYILESSLQSHKGNKKSSKKSIDVLSGVNISYTKEAPSYKVMVDDRPLNPVLIKKNATLIKVIKKTESKVAEKTKQSNTPTKSSVAWRKLPVLKITVIALLLVATVTTILAEGKVVYHIDSKNLSARVEFIKPGVFFNSITEIISR